ncbi:methyltransferase family protein [Mangrovibacterium diazotrophicum]|uniref:Protein-S-isoprenylcysteine O-methyltransferase Ste14 n=1 Tax=Mangrovibacterium diazotrophicum TaxID=1261403 RepID=A0A419W6D5_9BACT|nr:methyltransferase [Mangrovibacterium diazotrophicum]RKD91015.1 protein-S-isoprenylcysteine O-methyltransferase Ste14 [Mangrovibacterium diazotrophicum]
MQFIQLGLIILSLVPTLATLLLAYQIMRAGFSALGKPSINSALFYYSKSVVALVFALLIIVSFFPGFFLAMPLLIQNDIAAVQKLMSMIFLFAGNILLLPAYYTMGIFTRVGLPTSEHVLQTEGVYRVTRNPMYTSFFFFFAAGFLLIPSILLAVLMLVALILHHRIIKKEEVYLKSAFGEVYLDYKSQVARYL